MKREHIVKSFDEELAKLDRMVVEMGGLAEAQLAGAVTALTRRDVEMAMAIVGRDKRIDALEEEIHAFTIRLLALRQPMADDLRIVFAALKISSSLERVGDYAKNIAKRTFALAKTPPLTGASQSIARMGSLVQIMIKNVLDAYVHRDVALAEDVRERDAEVDQIHTSLFRELLTYMMEDPRHITTATHLLFVAKNVERIGDHATGVAEQVIFMIEGSMPEDERAKEDTASFAVFEASRKTGDAS